VQRASDAAAHESEENAAKETEANEKVDVDNEPEDKTSIDPETSSSDNTIVTELRALLSDTVSSNKESNHHLTANKGGKRNRIKSKVAGIVESRDTSEKENLTSLEEKSK